MLAKLNTHFLFYTFCQIKQRFNKVQFKPYLRGFSKSRRFRDPFYCDI